MAEDPTRLLSNRWIHSHEEDTGSEMVFRSADFDFPRSRGRTGFELKPDQSMIEIQPGADDRPEKTQGKWELQPGNKLAFFKKGSAEPSRSLKIMSAENDKLVLAKSSELA